jgi:hypothetical protein
MLFVLLLGGASVASADFVKEDSRFALHRTATTTKVATICTTANPNTLLIPCTEYAVSGPVGYSLIYMVVGQAGEGILGVSFGIDYNGRAGQMNGIDPSLISYTACHDGLDFTNGFDLDGSGTVEPEEEWPAPRGGTRITWSTCQNTDIAGMGAHAVMGALTVYAYAEDVIRLTPNNNLDSGPELNVVTCGGAEVKFLEIVAPSLVDDVLPRVHLGGAMDQGYTPCGIIPARPTTWGKVKSLY